MKKRHFLNLFRSAWRTSFTEDNIKHAFEKPGIWPYNPALVLKVITRPITPPEAIEAPPTSSPILKTSRSVKSICRFQADYCKNPTKEKLEKLFKANEELAAQAALDKHTKDGLVKSLKHEKKCRNWGKRLNVLGQEANGPILFAATEVRVAQAISAEKEERGKQERARIDANKEAAAIKKAKREAEKALQAPIRVGNKAEVEAEEKAEKRAQKKKEAHANKASKDLPAKSKSPRKAKKAHICKKRVVRFVGVVQKEGLLLCPRSALNLVG
jgi:hypothetical protein